MAKRDNDRIDVTAHTRARRGPPKPKAPPGPGQTDFSADEEQAMRGANRSARQQMAQPDNDDDDLDGGL